MRRPIRGGLPGGMQRLAEELAAKGGALRIVARQMAAEMRFVQPLKVERVLREGRERIGSCVRRTYQRPPLSVVNGRS